MSFDPANFATLGVLCYLCKIFQIAAFFSLKWPRFRLTPSFVDLILNKLVIWSAYFGFCVSKQFWKSPAHLVFTAFGFTHSCHKVPTKANCSQLIIWTAKTDSCTHPSNSDKEKPVSSHCRHVLRLAELMSFYFIAVVSISCVVLYRWLPARRCYCLCYFMPARLIVYAITYYTAFILTNTSTVCCWSILFYSLHPVRCWFFCRFCRSTRR